MNPDWLKILENHSNEKINFICVGYLCRERTYSLIIIIGLLKLEFCKLGPVNQCVIDVTQNLKCHDKDVMALILFPIMHHPQTGFPSQRFINTELLCVCF